MTVIDRERSPAKTGLVPFSTFQQREIGDSTSGISIFNKRTVLWSVNGVNPKLRNGATYGAEMLYADPYPTAQDTGWV